MEGKDKGQNIINHPIVTIVTVVYNGEDYIEKTLRSITQQVYANVEYLIIDGGSEDNTVNIINKYIDKIDYFISEPDFGIYDAMNKGIHKAIGKWIIFMNAGDVFFNNETLLRVFSKDTYQKYDFIYGNVAVDYGDVIIEKNATDISTMMKGMPFSHQCVFSKTIYHKENQFNIEKKINADFEFFFDAYKNSRKFYFVDLTISIIESGGLSDVQRINSILGYWEIVGYNNININIYYIRIIIHELIKKTIKKIIGKKITLRLIARRK